MKNSKIITLVLLIATLIPGFVAGAEQVSLDFATKRWLVPENLYGAHVGSFGGAGTRIDATADGREDILSDYRAHRTAMDEAKVSYIRRDMDLHNVINEDLTFNRYMNNPANIDISKSQVAWAVATDRKVLFETTFMPSWLATKNAQCATRSQTCEPDNYAEWGRVVNAFLAEVGCDEHQSTCEVEVWNEPYLPQFFLSDGTCQQRIDAYQRLYTNTYSAIKAKYPGIKVGGPSGYIGFSCAKDLLTQFMQEVPASKVDFITIHSYADATLSQQLTDSMNLIRANGHGKNVKVTEFSAASPTVEGGPVQKHEFVLTSAYVLAASTEPTLTSLVKFQWADDNSYLDGKYYAHGPWRREMFSEAALDDAKYPGFYVSKQLGTIHPGGSSVVGTVTTKDLLALATTGSNGQYLTLVNRYSAAKTAISLTITGIAATEVRDLVTGVRYPVKNNVANVGDIPATSIRQFQIVGGSVVVAATPVCAKGTVVGSTCTCGTTNIAAGQVCCASGAITSSVAACTPTPAPVPTCNVNTVTSVACTCSGKTIATGQVCCASGDVASSVAACTPTSTEDGTPTYVLKPTAQSDLSLVQFEAEHGVQTGKILTQAVASAGAVIVPNSVFGEGRVVYTITVPTTDSYVLWGRTYAPNYNDDSFWVSVDGAPEALWDMPVSSGWNWNKVSARGETGPKRYTLTAGTHTITLRSRENGAAIEEWALSSDENYLPTARTA